VSARSATHPMPTTFAASREACRHRKAAPAGRLGRLPGGPRRSGFFRQCVIYRNRGCRSLSSAGSVRGSGSVVWAPMRVRRDDQVALTMFWI